MKFVLGILLGIIPALDTQQSYVGSAVARSGGMVLYAEEHEEFYEDGRRIRLNTIFRSQEQGVLATRSVDFSRNPFLPDFVMEDRRTGYLEGAEMTTGGIRLFVRRNKLEGTRDAIIPLEKAMVVDAGFNNFIQAHWDSLIAGNKLFMKFGVPARLDSYGFRVYRDGETLVNGKRAFLVKCDIDNFILRLFLDPIMLTYDSESRRLLVYEGISNISNERGENHVVKIMYQPYGP
jgi:hypothetical protein